MWFFNHYRSAYDIVRYARCCVCNTVYYCGPTARFPDDDTSIKCNGQIITRCIAMHREQDSPTVKIKRTIEFHKEG